jgi:hypothetical protein
MQLHTVEANDHTGWGRLACAEVDVVVWNLFEICNGASLWLLVLLLLAGVTTEGSFFLM